MFLSKKNISVSLFVLTLFISSISNAAFHHQEVVVDKRGNVVTSTPDGACVRTKKVIGMNQCTKTKIISILSTADKNVYFGFDSYKLTTEEKTKLNRISNILKRADQVESATILGYTDHLGSAAYNEALSRKRAKAVKDYLASQGYFNTNVSTVKGMGESLSKEASCDGKNDFDDKVSCLKSDRRVEIRVNYSKKKTIRIDR